jgi:hypothetical protein
MYYYYIIIIILLFLDDQSDSQQRPRAHIKKEAYTPQATGGPYFEDTRAALKANHSLQSTPLTTT